MEIKPFQEENYIEICGWYFKREKIPIPFYLLPKNGFIVSGVAAGFLYKTDSKLGLIENFVTNPNACSDDRNKALNLIIDSIIELCFRYKIKSLIGTTKHENLLNRSLNKGFKNLGSYNVVCKEIGD